jgi:hypothetical protein
MAESFLLTAGPKNTMPTLPSQSGDSLARNGCPGLSACRLAGQTGGEGKRGLFPLRIEEVLDEKKGLEVPMGELDWQLIPFR